MLTIASKTVTGAKRIVTRRYSIYANDGRVIQGVTIWNNVDAIPRVFDVPLDGHTMKLRRSELEAVAAGLGEFDTSEDGNLITLAEAVRYMPPRDRAPLWELATRRYGRHKRVELAAAEIGIDAISARELLAAFSHALAQVPPPEL